MNPVAEEKLLPELDLEYLDTKGYKYDLLRVGAEVRVIIRGYDLPPAYSPNKTDLMLRLPSGYPQSNPDMFWTRPDVKLSGGAYPNRADYYDPGADGWQRWSRHSDWRPGIDNLRTKLASVRRELARGE
jgi:hypothetical protein